MDDDTGVGTKPPDETGLDIDAASRSTDRSIRETIEVGRATRRAELALARAGARRLMRVLIPSAMDAAMDIAVRRCVVRCRADGAGTRG